MTDRWHAAIWPDGTWCWRYDLSAGSMHHMSDDYIKVSIPEWMGEDDLALFAHMVQSKGWTLTDIDEYIRYSIDGPL